MATQLANGLWSLVSGSLSFTHNSANYGPELNVIGAYGLESTLGTKVLYRVADGSVRFSQIEMGLVTHGFGSTAEYDQAKATGTQIADEGTPVIFAIHTSEVPIDMSGNKIVNGSEAVSPDGFVILSQLTNEIAALQASVVAGDLTNADAIAALTTVVNNLSFDGGLSEAQVTAIADARVAAGLLTQFDNATTTALLEQLRSQLASVDTAIIDDFTILQNQVADLEPRVAATETLNTAQNARLDAVEALDTVQSAQITAIEGVNAAQDAAIAALQTGLASETQTNAAQEILLQGHTTAIGSLNAVTTPIVVEVRNGIIDSVAGVAMNAVTIDSSNATHMVVSINTAGRKYCEATFLRRLNGASEEATCHKFRSGIGDVYGFAVKKTVAGSSDATFHLSGGSFF